MVSLLKAWYGDAATPDNEFGYQFLPKLVGDSSQEPMTMAMTDGIVKGQFIFGQNPVVGAVNSDMVARGLARARMDGGARLRADRDGELLEGQPAARERRAVPEDIATEVFFLPAALPGEKAGSVTNTSRLVQWHDQVCEAPGDSRSDLWFIFHLGRRLKQLYADSTETRATAACKP